MEFEVNEGAIQHIPTPSASIFDERSVTLASVSDAKGYPCASFFRRKGFSTRYNVTPSRGTRWLRIETL